MNGKVAESGSNKKEQSSGAKYSAPALEKGLDILELLSLHEGGLTQMQIAKQLNRSVSEIFRMLIVLAQRGYVAQDPRTDSYGLTTMLFEIAHRTPLVKRLTTLAGPMMQQLASQVNQSVHLAILSDDGCLIVGQVDSPDTNVMSVRLGTRIDLWKASSGRVILAYTPEERLNRYFTDVPLPQELTKTEVRAQLDYIRSVGYEIRDSFVVRGIVNISVPVIDHSGYAIAAVTIPFLERYQDIATFDECRRALQSGAQELSRNLGNGISENSQAVE